MSMVCNETSSAVDVGERAGDGLDRITVWYALVICSRHWP
jgi:hypothetical protein